MEENEPFKQFDKAMRKNALDQLNKEASTILTQVCEPDKHDWHYNNKSDEVYCISCGALNGDYKGLGVMLMKITELLK